MNDRISKVVSDKEMSDDMRAKFNGHIKAGNEAEMQYMFLLEKGMDLPVVTKHEEIIDIKYDDILKILGVEDEKTPLSELYKIYTALPENKRAEINDKLLNNQEITEEIKDEIKKYLETNDNENKKSY